MASNTQTGTRGLSAADWTRIKRIQGTRNFQVNTLKTGDGSSIIQFPASQFVDFQARNTGDYVTQSESVGVANTLGAQTALSGNISVAGIGKKLTVNRVCDCAKTYALSTKLTTCAKCKNRF
jgi:hypothetical protein